MNLDNYEFIKDLINFLVVPLFAWIWWTDRKVNKIELTAVKHQDLKDLYIKLDEINKNINSLNDKYTSQKFCDFRHNKTT